MFMAILESRSHPASPLCGRARGSLYIKAGDGDYHTESYRTGRDRDKKNTCLGKRKSRNGGSGVRVQSEPSCQPASHYVIREPFSPLVFITVVHLVPHAVHFEGEVMRRWVSRSRWTELTLVPTVQQPTKRDPGTLVNGRMAYDGRAQPHCLPGNTAAPPPCRTSHF